MMRPAEAQFVLLLAFPRAIRQVKNIELTESRVL